VRSDKPDELLKLEEDKKKKEEADRHKLEEIRKKKEVEEKFEEEQRAKILAEAELKHKEAEKKETS